MRFEASFSFFQLQIIINICSKGCATYEVRFIREKSSARFLTAFEGIEKRLEE